MSNVTRGLLLWAAIASCQVVAQQNNDVEALLLAADEVRSADPVAFDNLLNQLKMATAVMSPSQTDHLKFLKAYKDAYSGQYALAEPVLQALITEGKTAVLRFRAAFTLANIQIIQRQFIPAFSNLTIALTHLPDIDDDKWRIQALTSIAFTYMEAGVYQESLEYLAQLKKFALKGRDHCLYLSFLLQNHQHLGMAVTTADIHAAEQACSAANEATMLAIVKLQYAKLSIKNKDLNGALSALLKMETEVELTRFPRTATEYYQLLATVYAELGQYNEAETALATMYQFGNKVDFSLPIVAGLKLHADIAAQKLDFAKAYQLQQKYSEAERAMRDEHSNRLLAYQLAKGELLKKNQQLQLMKEEFRVMELENQLKNQQAQRDSLYILLLSLASIVLVYVTYRLVRRHRFYKLAAENDGLTGISNRHFFDLQLQKQVKRCKQQQKSLGVIVFDLDFFKQINDSYGHDIGDKALQATVRICNHFIRSGDIFGRIGGEEFAIALPDCQPDKVLMLAEICRDAIEQLDCSDIQKGLKLTASFGVAYSQISGYQCSELMRHADQALYLAKYNGRNRVESYDQMQHPPGRPLIHSPLR